MADLVYVVDGEAHSFNCSGVFARGVEGVLSDGQSDVTFGQDWYAEGYACWQFLSGQGFALLKSGLNSTIGKIVTECTGRAARGFTLEKYHRFVESDDEHLMVVRRTADLFPADFGFPVLEVTSELQRQLGFGLSAKDPRTGVDMHIIVRINRPGSSDYNPPHKDIYEHYDGDHGGESYLPLFMNFWIPVCGVDSRTSLPLAPGSHLLPEIEIERTKVGAVFGGKKYRVRAVRSWGGRNELFRPTVSYGEVLAFSGHLIHGLALNGSEDTTRVSLEFRLFRSSVGE